MIQLSKHECLDWSGKLLLVLTSTYILGSDSRGTHCHNLCPACQIKVPLIGEFHKWFSSPPPPHKFLSYSIRTKFWKYCMPVLL
jgi:hypothetical protein